MDLVTFDPVSELIHFSMRASLELDTAVERWGARQNRTGHQRMKDKPGDGRPIAEVEARFRAKHGRRL